MKIQKFRDIKKKRGQQTHDRRIKWLRMRRSGGKPRQKILHGTASTTNQEVAHTQPRWLKLISFIKKLLHL